MTDPWTPTTDEIAALLQPLSSFPRLILAVSGGSDSVALMHLVARWTASLSGSAPDILVATVDHGLRSGSRDETEGVAAAARALGFETRILTWSGEKPTRGVQAAARRMRYRLLGECAVTSGSGRCAVVTAHTSEDQAETLLMRLARGSGPDGLQAMRPQRSLTPFPDVVLARPLLGVSRGALRFFLGASGLAWFDDPSNADRRFERIRLRDADAVLAGLGLTPAMLTLAATRQRRAVDALDAATDRLQAAAFESHDGAYAACNGILFANAPEEIRVRLTARILAMFGGASPPAQLAEIERLVCALATTATVRTTLGGCEIRACRREIRVFRERGRADLSPIRLHPGEEATWDRRFLIRLAQTSPPVVVRPLDRASLVRLRQTSIVRPLLPFRAAATLPAVWSGEDLVSVGGLGPRMGAEAGTPSLVETRFVFAGHLGRS
jgi:tRNA(Ile)-lysidine synthase